GLTDGPAATREGKRPKLSPLLLPFSLVFFTLAASRTRNTQYGDIFTPPRRDFGFHLEQPALDDLQDQGAAPEDLDHASLPRHLPRRLPSPLADHQSRAHGPGHARRGRRPARLGVDVLRRQSQPKHHLR